jgi:hypothetical protein
VQVNLPIINLFGMLLTDPIDTFELQSKGVTSDDAIQTKHDDGGFDALGEEDEEVYDVEIDEDDDGDALSSSPSIPDDVRSICSCFIVFAVLIPMCIGHRF